MAAVRAAHQQKMHRIRGREATWRTEAAARAAQVRPQPRRKRFDLLGAIEAALVSIELTAVVLPLLVLVLACGAGVVYLAVR